MDVTLVLTHDCNLGCGYCYAGAKFNRRMPSEIASKGIDMALDSGAKEVQLSFFGGEPLLAWEELVRSTKEARAKANAKGIDLRLCVTTNGTLLTDERAAILGDLDVYVGLSIDGTREAHEAGRPKMGGGSSFDDVLRGLDVLLRRGTSFETISVVSPANVRWLGESVRFLLGRGVPRAGLNPCYEAYFSDDDLEAYGRGLAESADLMIELYRAGRLVSLPVFENKILAALKGGLADTDKCSLGVREVSVAPSGNLYPCERLVAEDEDPKWVVGHVDRGFDVKGEGCARGPSNPECNDCGERTRCSSHCACANLAETGRTDVAGGTQCWHERETGMLADRVAETLWNERNEIFLAWFYGRMAAAGIEPMDPPDRKPVQVIERAPRKKRNRLQVVL